MNQITLLTIKHPILWAELIKPAVVTEVNDVMDCEILLTYLGFSLPDNYNIPAMLV